MRSGVVTGIILVALACAGAGYWYFVDRPTATVAEARAPVAGEEVVTVEAVPVAIDRITLTIPAVGTLRSNESIVISPEIAGRLAEILVEEGSKVEAGTLVAVLDKSVYAAVIAEMEANLTLSKISYERAVDLYKRKVGTQQAVDQAQSTYGADQARLAVARAQFEKTKIVAPFTGVVGLRRVSVGQYLTAGDPIINLESIDPLKVDFRVPEIYFPVVRVGQGITLKVDALPNDSFSGTVYAIDPLIDANGRNIVIRARIPNPDARLRPGLFVRVALEYESRDEAILVPEQALVPIGAGKFVYRVVDGIVRQTEVKIGERAGARVEIIEGLTAGDVVVTAGQLKIRDGATVTVTPPQAATGS